VKFYFVSRHSALGILVFIISLVIRPNCWRYQCRGSIGSNWLTRGQSSAFIKKNKNLNCLLYWWKQCFFQVIGPIYEPFCLKKASNPFVGKISLYSWKSNQLSQMDYPPQIYFSGILGYLGFFAKEDILPGVILFYQCSFLTFSMVLLVKF